MAHKQAIFQEVADEIQRRVEAGVYVSAQRLPSEYDLAKEFSVSRLTVRKAIDSLIAKNILVKQRSKGTYVMKTDTKIQSGRAGLQGFTEAAKAYGKDSQTKIIDWEEVMAEELPVGISEMLQIENNNRVYHLTRLRLLDNQPMTLEELYIKSRYLPEYDVKQLESSLFQLIEENIEIAYSHQEVEAVLIDDYLSEHLAVPVGQPVLKVRSLTYSADAKPILFDTSYYRADKYTFKNTLQRER